MTLTYEKMEKARLDLLSDLEILDTVQEEIYDDLTTLAEPFVKHLFHL